MLHALLALAAAALPQDIDEPAPPNVVLILCDDMGWSDIGCYGGEVRTPNIDRLATEGVRFSSFYNNAKCTTTRASVVTGLWPRRKGGLLQDSMVTIGEVLRERGYRTALSGKWHLGSKAPKRPIDRGFDEFYGLLDGCCNFFDPVQPDPPFKGGRTRVFAHNDERITEFPGDYYTTDAFTDHAVEMVHRFTEEEKPFLLHVCYTAPHYPLHALPEDIAKYEGRYAEGWDALREERHARLVESGLIDPDWTLPERDREATSWEDAEHKEWQQRRMEVYSAMIDRMDQGIGRILAALDETGVADNTMVLFLSDNGACAEIPGGEKPEREPGPKEFYTTCGPGWAYAQNTPFRRYKQWVHEGGIATPLVVRWPSVVEPNTVSHEVGHIVDFLPTFLEAAGGTYPTERGGVKILPVEGLSMLPVLAGGSREAHRFLAWEWGGNRAVRRGKWKLVWDRKVKAWELYDLVSDRTETRDLVAEEPELAAELEELWWEWAALTGVKAKRPASDER